MMGVVIIGVLVLVVVAGVIKICMDGVTPNELCDECEDALSCRHYCEGGTCWFADPDNLEVDDDDLD